MLWRTHLQQDFESCTRVRFNRSLCACTEEESFVRKLIQPGGTSSPKHKFAEYCNKNQQFLPVPQLFPILSSHKQIHCCKINMYCNKPNTKSSPFPRLHLLPILRCIYMCVYIYVCMYVCMHVESARSHCGHPDFLINLVMVFTRLTNGKNLV